MSPLSHLHQRITASLASAAAPTRAQPPEPASSADERSSRAVRLLPPAPARPPLDEAARLSLTSASVPSPSQSLPPPSQSLASAAVPPSDQSARPRQQYSPQPTSPLPHSPPEATRLRSTSAQPQPVAAFFQPSLPSSQPLAFRPLPLGFLWTKPLVASRLRSLFSSRSPAVSRLPEPLPSSAPSSQPPSRLQPDARPPLPVAAVRFPPLPVASRLLPLSSRCRSPRLLPPPEVARLRSASALAQPTSPSQKLSPPLPAAAARLPSPASQSRCRRPLPLRSTSVDKRSHSSPLSPSQLLPLLPSSRDSQSLPCPLPLDAFPPPVRDFSAAERLDLRSRSRFPLNERNASLVRRK